MNVVCNITLFPKEIGIKTEPYFEKLKYATHEQNSTIKTCARLHHITTGKVLNIQWVNFLLIWTGNWAAG